MDNRTWLTRTGNPGLNDKTFSGLPRAGIAEAMTLQGTINKSFLLLVVLLAAALWPWSQFFASGNPAVVLPAMLGGGIAGLVLALIISFKATLAPYLSIPYAACEGLVIGGISAVLEKRYPGIAIQAVGLTFGVHGSAAAGLHARGDPGHAALPGHRGRRHRRDRAAVSGVVGARHVSRGGAVPQ